MSGLRLCQSKNTRSCEEDDNNEIFVSNDTQWRVYAECTAGLDFIVGPLACIPKFSKRPRMLDVGCGFGFAMLYAKTLFHAQCTGFEPDIYGQMGAKNLGLDIKNSYFEKTDQEYDIVYSSEVIEHVPDPYAFIKNLTSALSKNGVLIITTPNAKFLDKKYSNTNYIQEIIQCPLTINYLAKEE